MGIRKNAEGKYVLSVDGVDTEVTEEQLYEMGSKAHGANARFEAANKLKREAEGAVSSALEEAKKNFATLFVQTQRGDIESYGRMLDMAGYSADQKIDMLTSYKEAWAGQAAGGGGDAEDSDDDGQGAGGATQMPEELRELMQMAVAMKQAGLTPAKVVDVISKGRKSQVEEEKQSIFNKALAALDDKPELVRILRKGGPKAERLRGLTTTLVKERIRDGAKPSPELYTLVGAEVLAMSKDLGILTDESISHPGLGLVPGLSIAESQAGTPDKPVNISDPNYSNQILADLAAEVRKLESGGVPGASM